MWYSWIALPHDTGEPPVALGIIAGDGPGTAQHLAAGFLRSGKAFLGTVEECWPLGRAWDGRRNTAGGVSWRERAPRMAP